jgi:hypothetical protein
MTPAQAILAAIFAFVLHVTPQPDVVAAIDEAATSEGVPVERLASVCFIESTLGEGRPALLCGYQGRITAEELAAWNYGEPRTRANPRWQSHHAARALRRWYSTVCVRGPVEQRWRAASSFYNSGLRCDATTRYANDVAATVIQLRWGLAHPDEVMARVASGEERVCAR